MSATTAIHSVATPITAMTRNAALEPDRERDVRADVAHRRAAQAQRVGNLQQLVGHQRDVGGFERGVAAGDAHRDADVGGGERGRVVDPVADHRERAETARAAPRRRAPCPRGSSPARTSSTPTASPSARAADVMVPGQQRDVRDAVLAQHPHRLARRFARPIRHADDPDGLLGADDHHRLAAGGERRGLDQRVDVAASRRRAPRTAGGCRSRRACRPRALRRRGRAAPGTARPASSAMSCSRARATMAAPIGCSDRARATRRAAGCARAPRRSAT